MTSNPYKEDAQFIISKLKSISGPDFEDENEDEQETARVGARTAIQDRAAAYIDDNGTADPDFIEAIQIAGEAAGLEIQAGPDSLAIEDFKVRLYSHDELDAQDHSRDQFI